MASVRRTWIVLPALLAALASACTAEPEQSTRAEQQAAPSTAAAALPAAETTTTAEQGETAGSAPTSTAAPAALPADEEAAPSTIAPPDEPEPEAVPPATTVPPAVDVAAVVLGPQDSVCIYRGHRHGADGARTLVKADGTAADSTRATAAEALTLPRCYTTTYVPSIDREYVHDVIGHLDSLVVAPEAPDGYSWRLFPHWRNTDGDGCDARSQVLRAEAVFPPTFTGRAQSCRLTGGLWYSAYDGQWSKIGNGDDVAVDHLVSLREAWESGAHAWPDDQRAAFANDTFVGSTLVAVTVEANRAKGDLDPAEWLPVEQHRCWYAAEWVRTKLIWNLTVDQAEAEALRAVLSGCADRSLVLDLPTDIAPPVPDDAGVQGPLDTPLSELITNAACHPDYDSGTCLKWVTDLSCGEIDDAAKPVRLDDAAVDPLGIDLDGDGWGCVSDHS